MRVALLTIAGFLTACTGTSHIPPPWELPGAAAGAVIENATYGAKRKRVKAFVSENFNTLKAEILAGSGPALSKAFSLAGVPDKNQPTLIADLQSNPHIYFQNSDEENVEATTVAFMVYGD